MKIVRESLDEEPYVDYEEPDVDEFGTIRWRNEDGKLHREDGPAVEYINGTKFWYLNGKLHREDGPAVEDISGTKSWWLNDKLHREDGPAVIRADGSKAWWLNGERQPDYFGKKPVRESLVEEPYVDYEEHEPEIDMFGNKRWYNENNTRLHREDGPAVEFANGDKAWYINNKLHREDGPAIEFADGTNFWFINNRFHREDGPALEYKNGDKEWYLNGERQPDYFGKKPVRESLDEEPYYVDYEEHEPEIDLFGNKYWYINGELHREDGPAIEFINSTKEWWINDKRHREDGPAVIRANGDKLWFINHKLHREDGPAIEWAHGYRAWYLNDKRQPDYFGKKPVRESLDEEFNVEYEDPDHDPDVNNMYYAIFNPHGDYNNGIPLYFITSSKREMIDKLNQFIQENIPVPNRFQYSMEEVDEPFLNYYISDDWCIMVDDENEFQRNLSYFKDKPIPPQEYII